MPPSNYLEFADGTFHGSPIKYRKDHLIVKFKQYSFHTATATRLLDTVIGPGNHQLVGEPIGRWTYLWVDVEPDKLLAKINDLHQHPDTEFAEPDLALIPAARPQDPLLKEGNDPWQWGPEYMGMFQAWDIQAGTSDVVIGLLDSGVPLPKDPVPDLEPHASLEGYVDHEDLDGKRFLAGKDFVNEERVWPRDDYESTAHGTQMAGIIAAMADNTDDEGTFLGTAGINWGSSVYAYKAQHKSVSHLDIDSIYRSTCAIFYLGIWEIYSFAKASEPHKKVVLNVSAIFENDPPPGYDYGTLAAIFELVLEMDAVICCGAGPVAHEVQNPAKFGSDPGDPYAANVVVVGAVDHEDKCMGNLAHEFDDMVYAPGVEVGTLFNPTIDEPNTMYAEGNGTSHATAHVSALAAVMWSEAPHLSAAEIVRVLKTTCRAPKSEAMESFEEQPGHGIVQAYEALKELKTRVCLVLDKSGSMGNASGIGGKSRLDIMKTAAKDLVDLVDVGSSLGLVSFSSSAVVMEEPKLIEITDPVSGASQSRTDLQARIDSLTSGGFTSIGSGVKTASSVLSTASSPRAIIVLTDGQENHQPFLSSLPDGPDETKVYGIGMGTAQTLLPHGLATLTEDTDGYLILDEEFATGASHTLSKFLGQIIAEISGAEPVTDPMGGISPGQELSIPFVLGEADAAAEVILLRPDHAPIGLEIVSPNGDSWTETQSTTSVNGRITRCRFSPPGGHLNRAADHYGQWEAILTLTPLEFAKWLADGGAGGSTDNDRDQGAIPFSVWVNSRSRLRMTCSLRQSGYSPGSSMTLCVGLTSGGISVPWTDPPTVSVSGPTEDALETDVDATNPNGIEFTINAIHPGIYRWDILAMESHGEGILFQRERRLTGAVWDLAGPGAPGQPTLVGPVRTSLFPDGGWVGPTRPDSQA